LTAYIKGGESDQSSVSWESGGGGACGTFGRFLSKGIVTFRRFAGRRATTSAWWLWTGTRHLLLPPSSCRAYLPRDAFTRGPGICILTEKKKLSRVEDNEEVVMPHSACPAISLHGESASTPNLCHCGPRLPRDASTRGAAR